MMTNTTSANQRSPRLAFAIACLLPAILLGCATENPPIVTKTDSRIQALVGGEAAARLIADLSQARICIAHRVGGFLAGEGPLPPPGTADEPQSQAVTSDKPQDIYGYPVVSSAVPIDDVSRANLSKVFSDPGTYLWDVAKACEFLPGVALRFAGSNVRVDILICFSCDELEIYRNGERVGHEDFDPRRSDLLGVVKKLFPEDEAIQALN
jgi:hypothetical protein